MGGGRNLIIIPGEKNVGSSLEDINANFSEIDTALGNKSDKGHTHNYAGSSSPGGAATSAVSDSTGADISESFANVKSDIAVNKATMGCKCKNLLKSTAVTQTINGVTFTVNDDKSITVNGTATSRIVIATGKAYIQQAGNYTYTGTPSGGSSATYSMNYRSGNIYKDTDIGNGVTAQFEGGKTYEAVIDIRSGVTVSDLTFYPMLRYADITDDSYEPYVEDINTRINNIISDYLPKSGGTISGSLTVNGALKTERSGALLLSATTESSPISGTIENIADYTCVMVNAVIHAGSGNALGYYQFMLPVQYIISNSGYNFNFCISLYNGTIVNGNIAAAIDGDILTLKQQVPGAGYISRIEVINLI